jgi:hypothetical protein
LRQIRTLPKTLSSAGRTFSSWRILLSIGNTSCESGVLAVARAQAVERQKRHATGFVLVQVLDDLGRDVVVVDDDVEQLVRRRRLDGGEEALVALHQLDQEDRVHP